LKVYPIQTEFAFSAVFSINLRGELGIDLDIGEA
jgi:hypothetical protein